MKMVKVSIFLLMWNFLQILAQVPNRELIESLLTNTTTELISMEMKVKQKVGNFNALVKICSSNLKASNISTNFTDVLDKYAVRVQEVQTINDHEVFNVSLVSLQSYDYSQFRIATLFSDVKRLREIKNNLSANSSVLYGFSKDIRKQFQSNFLKMLKLTSKRKLVNSVIQELLKLFSTFRSYFQLLNIHTGNYMKLNSHLSKLIITKAIPAPSNVTLDPLMTNIRSIESKLVPAQQQVITMAKVAIRKVEAAQMTVASSRKVQVDSSLGNIFTKIKFELNKTAQTNEYSLLGWPKFPDISGDGATVRLRAKMCDDKVSNYEVSKKWSLRNQTILKDHQETLNATTFGVQTSRKVRAQSQAVVDVLLALTNVDNSLKNNVIKLEKANEELNALKVNLFTTTSTTTTIPTTTTAFVKPACGTFLPFNPLTDLALVAAHGVSAGTYSDGSLAYVGKGDNSAYLGLASCPARISVNPSKPGAFMSTNSAEVFDNKTAFFLANHEDIVWGTVTERTSWNYFYGFKMMSGSYPVMIGRVNISGVTYVGRVHYGNGLLGLHIYREDLNQVVKLGLNDPFEVVGCVYEGVGCVTQVDFNIATNSTAAFMNGLVVGMDFDGYPAYVGVSNIVTCPLFGMWTYALSKISINPKNPGAFMTCHNETFSYEMKFNNSAFIRETNHNTWRPATLSNITSVPGYYGFWDMVDWVVAGRYQMSNWTMFGRVVYSGARMGFYGWNPETQSVLKLPANAEFEIVCCI